jgi:large subunit ribosomal protein L29|tara:strand:- start:55 stop:246 length:192 start_codon:yes stop_codon:yes gene_type:complete
MKKKDIKKLTIDQAKKDLEKNKKDLFNLRFQKANGQLTNTSKVNETKKNIAKLITYIEGKKSA